MTEWTRERIDTTAEQNLTIGLITKAEFLAGIIPHFKPRYLTTPLSRTVANWCIEYYGQYGKAPGLHVQDIFIAQQKRLDPDLSALLERFLTNLNENYKQLEGELNPEYLLDESIKYLQERAVDLLMEDVKQHRQTGNITAAVEAVQDFRAMTGPREALKPGYTGAEMLRATFTEPQWIVKGLIPQGFSPLCGPPKVGKSWLALNLCISIATGGLFLGRYQVEQGAALYLDFELPDVKVKERLKKCLGGRRDLPGLDNLRLQPSGSWPRIHQGGLEMLEDFVGEHPDLKLVVIDVWRKFSRPRKAQEENSYSLTYEDVGPVKDFADRHGLLVLVIHHLSKGWRKYESPFEAFLGSTALAGASDNLYALVREEEHGELWATGRDIEESKTALEFSKDDCTWYWLGQAEKFRLTQDQRAIYEALEEAGKPLSPKEIGAIVGKPVNNVSEMLFRMMKQGRVEKEGYGKYKITPISPITTNHINTPISPITSPIQEEDTLRGYRAFSTISGKVDWSSSEMREKLRQRGEISYRSMPDLN
jgi:RecA-family ATPase